MTTSRRSRFFNPETETVFYAGLDLGKSNDFSAITVVRRCPGASPVYHVIEIKRFPLGTSYVRTVDITKKALSHPEIQPILLVLDGTGVGAAVADLFREAQVYFIPVVITGGGHVTRGGGNVRVPKKDLIMGLQVLFQSNRLKIAGRIPEAKLLMDELLKYQVTISNSGNDKFSAPFGEHDDCLVSLSLAVWASENHFLPKGLLRRINTGRRQLYPTSTKSLADHQRYFETFFNKV